MEELEIFYVCQIGTALDRYPDYLERVGCYTCAADTRDLSKKILESRVFVKPFNTELC